MKWGTIGILKEWKNYKRTYAENKGLQELVKKFNLNQKSIKVPQQMISVKEEETANKVFSCFEKRRFEESSNDQSNEIEEILQSEEDGESRNRIVNWRHTKVTSSCSDDSMSSLPGLGGNVEGRMDSSACGG